MSDDLRTTETMQENAEHFVDVVTRVAKALMQHAPHVYDPASDDMTVEFAIQLADKDEEIARLRALSLPEPTEGQVEAMAKAAFEIDWPKDDWSRFTPGDYVPERYRKIVRAALRSMPLQNQTKD